jgi:surface protein
MGRIVEKSLLRVDDPGNADQIFDVVRCMVQCKSMRQVAEVVRRVSESKKVELVRCKERFELRVSGGGWRDCMLNFVVTPAASVGDAEQEGRAGQEEEAGEGAEGGGEEKSEGGGGSTAAKQTCRVICELQIVHEGMMTARKGLPGHIIYNRVRTASELLEAGPGKLRPRSNEELREMVKDWIAGRKEELKPIGMWDTSLITDMSKLFDEQREFNDDIGGWDTSQVTDMHSMFYDASTFNQPLDSWNVSRGTKMFRMFYKESKAGGGGVTKPAAPPKSCLWSCLCCLLFVCCRLKLKPA